MIMLKIQELAYALLRKITGQCRVCNKPLHPKNEQICSDRCEEIQQDIDTRVQAMLQSEMDDIEMRFELDALEQEAEVYGWSDYNIKYYQAIKDELNRVEREWNEYINKHTK